MRAKKRQIVKVVIFAAFLFLLLIVRYFVGFIIVQGASMEPTYRNGDFVIIYKAEKSYCVDDIVAFKMNDILYIKRVVGVPGDQIEFEDRCVYRNGIPLLQYRIVSEDCSIILSDNEYYVIGDNFQNSLDSRDFGPIEAKSVIGKTI